MNHSINLNSKQLSAYSLMCKGENIFITGGGGVGKSTLIKYFVNNNRKYKKIAVTSTTGISAVLINGTTLHSFLKIGLGNRSQSSLIDEIMKNKYMKDNWVKTDVLIIDEISMLNPDLFEKLDNVAQFVRGNERPYGGMQIILSGDFCQLPCVKTDKFCFEAENWDSVVTTTINLDEIIRQTNIDFQNCLNKIRLGNIDNSVKKILSDRINVKLKNDLGIKPTQLYPVNRSVDEINNKCLEKLVKKTNVEYTYECETDFKTPIKKHQKIFENTKNRYVFSESLTLSINCQVMLVVNYDQSENLINGSRGVVIKFDETDDLPIVRFINGLERKIDYYSWEITADDKKIGSVSQIPLKLGYAFSIHKAQGCTLDYAIIDLRDIFEYGMGYVALSRVTDLNGLSIKGIDWDNIACNPKVIEYYSKL